MDGVGINLWTGRRSNPQRKNWDQIADNCLIEDDSKGIRRDWYQTDTHVYVTFCVKARSGSVVTGGNFVSVTGTYQGNKEGHLVDNIISKLHVL